MGDNLSSWVPTTHLVQSRIDALAQLAERKDKLPSTKDRVRRPGSHQQQRRLQGHGARRGRDGPGGVGAPGRGATFVEVGVRSLMSLVIAEKLREQLGIAVSGSLFLECPTVGDLRAWLLEYHS